MVTKDNFGTGGMLKPLMGIMMISAILPMIGGIVPKSNYTLTYAAGPNGTITGTTPQTVQSGASGTAVTAVPATGYRFTHWSDTSTVNPRTDTNVIASKSVVANFEPVSLVCPIDGQEFLTLALLQAHFASAHPSTPIDIVWS